MKYVMTVLFATTMSFGAFALGQGANPTGHQDCCTTGKCGGGMPMCGAPRISQKRETAPVKKNMSTGKKAGAKNQ